MDRCEVVRDGQGAVLDVVLPAEQMSPLCGCQAKTSGHVLRPQLVAGLGADVAAADDCAVVDMEGHSSLLLTTDFHPLVGTSIYRAGRIAAQHAMSDVWAMGGRPLYAVATVIHADKLPDAALGIVVRGLATACAEAEVALVGGHTSQGEEAMAGLTVIGVPGSRVITKGGARPGDVLMLSKPVGSGALVRALHLGLVGPEDAEPALVSMETSNQAASAAAVAAGATALTDVTGFGVIGHLAELLEAGQVGAVLDLAAVPVFPAVNALPASVLRTHWIDQNLEFADSLVRVTGLRDRIRLAPLLDPQTSGGLLAAVDADKAAAMTAAGYVPIGVVTATQGLEVRS